MLGSKEITKHKVQSLPSKDVHSPEGDAEVKRQLQRKAEQCQCLSPRNWLNKLWYIHIVK